MSILHRFQVKTKVSASHRMDLSKFLALQVFNMWQFLPNIFIRPESFDSKFFFVCGCGHSGTTLVAAKLGLSGNVFFTGRETNAFFPIKDLYGARRLALEWDHLAKLNGKSYILEKTPKHIHSIKMIKKVIPEAKFVVLTRNPLDSVASLYQRFGGMEACISRWNEDNDAGLKWIDDPQVILIKYEDLVTSPEKKFQDIFRFASLTWDPNILDAGPTDYEKVMQKSELYRKRVDQVSKPITPNLGSWKSFFSEKQAKRVFKKTERRALSLGYDRDFLERFNIITSDF